MSISGALTSALSGLGAAARGAEIVSQNIANARTEGYGRRELLLEAAGGTSAGVRVSGITRHADPQLLADRRAAGAAEEGAALRAGFHAGLERVLGLPSEPGSLTDRLATFEAALTAAASRPDSTARLEAVHTAAAALATHLNRATDHVQDQRMQADAAIATSVERLNAGLQEVATLNARIARFAAVDKDASGLVDRRQQVIDDIARIVPLREMPRDHGRVALMTPGGALLLDTRPVEVGFTPAGVIAPEMSLQSGALSGLTLDGRPVAMTDGGPMGGGTLAAHFAIRDAAAPGAQARLDAFSRDLVERLADPGVDPTLAPGAPGLFTDAGAMVDAGAEVGLAGRIAVNEALSPAADGLWRLRAGIGAAGPGDPGDARVLMALAGAMAAPRVAASGGFGPSALGAAALAAEVSAGIATARTAAEADGTAAGAEVETLRLAELRQGVDTDAELQTLLSIERAYAANARVMSVIDEMLANLTRI